MDKKQEVTVKGGVGFVGLLTIVLIALKLMGYISWSWAWVFFPAWTCGVFGLGAIAGVIGFVSKI
jgi:hypothetical protein